MKKSGATQPWKCFINVKSFVSIEHPYTRIRQSVAGEVVGIKPWNKSIYAKPLAVSSLYDKGLNKVISRGELGSMLADILMCYR